MTMEKQTFEDVPPIKNCDFPSCQVKLVEGKSKEASYSIECIQLLGSSKNFYNSYSLLCIYV